MKNKITFQQILFAVLAMVAFPALAGPFDPPAGDASMRILGEALAGLLPGTSGGGPLADIFKIFNSAVLVVAGLVVAYVLLVGTLNTAHDGEMMGKKWSSIWVPLRTALGVALIVPVGGACLAQMLVAWLAVQGIGLADKAWSAFATSSYARGDLVIQARSPKVDHMAGEALAALVCVESINKVIAQTPNAAALGATPASITRTSEPENEILNFGGGAVPLSACGQIIFKNKTVGGLLTGGLDATYKGIHGGAMAEGAGAGAAIGAAAGGPIGAAIGGAVGGGASLFDLKWVGFTKQSVPPTATEAAHRQAMGLMLQQLQPLAHAIVMAGDEGWASADAQKAALAGAIATYERTVLTAAQGDAAAVDMEGMGAAMAEDGWLLAAAWFQKIVQSQQKLTEAIERVPSVHAGRPDLSIFADELERAQIRLGSFLKSSGRQRYAIENFAKEKNAKSDSDSSSAIMNALLSAFTDLDIGNMGEDTRNPVIIAKDMGDRLLAWGAGGFAALGILMVVPGAGAIGTAAGLILFAGITAGVLLSVATPVLPFVIFMGGAIAWIILLVEALVAAPLVALMKLDPNGDGLIGGTRHAYMLLLSVVLRPVLMVIGMVACLLLLPAIGRLLGQTVFAALSLTKGTGMAWLLATIGSIFVFAAILMAAIHALFSLIHVIPDRVVRWIGGGHESHGSAAGDEHARQAKTVVGGLASTTQNIAANGPKRDPRKDQKRDGKDGKGGQTEGGSGIWAARAKTSGHNASTHPGRK